MVFSEIAAIKVNSTYSRMPCLSRASTQAEPDTRVATRRLVPVGYYHEARAPGNSTPK